MIDGMEPSEFRRQHLYAHGKASLMPDEARYNRDGAYAFQLDSRADFGYASFIVCKLVDELIIMKESGKKVSIGELNEWHVEYVKAGFHAAKLPEIAKAFAKDPMQGLSQINKFLTLAPPVPAGFRSGH